MALHHLFELCRFLSEADLGRTPPAVVHRAKLVLLDTLGVITSGSGVAEAARTAERLAGFPPEGAGATCPGRRGDFHPLWAAMVNGMGGSSLEFEEGNAAAMGHPAIQIAPAVSAAAEAGGYGGEDLLMGLLGGYEAASRISRASSIRRGLHPTGTWGVVGSALGVGRVLRKEPEALHQIAHIAASYAFSPYVKNSFVGKKVASTFAGMVNHLGILANLFFESGVRADEGSFEMTFSRFVSEALDQAILSAGLGEEYAIMENYFKPYPTCRFTHPALDALGALLAKRPLCYEEVEGITVWSFKEAVHATSTPPPNLEAMRFSLPFLVAARLLRGEITLETLTEDLLEDPRVRDMATRVDLVFSSPYEQWRPRRSPAKVLVRLRNGESLRHEVLDCSGDPMNPMPEAAIVGKFLGLTGPIVGERRAARFVKRWRRLESERDLRSLFSLLRPEETGGGETLQHGGGGFYFL